MYTDRLICTQHKITNWQTKRKMVTLEEKRIKQLEKHLPEFTRKVDPIELLPYLRCLTRSSKEEIENRQRQNNKSQAAMKLYDHLIRMDDWWSCLLTALHSTDLHQLADTLEAGLDEDDRPAIGSHRRKQSRRRARSYRGDTKVKNLPSRVTSILKILDSQDVDKNWEAMAAYLNYTMEEVTRIKCNQNETSCTKKLLEVWSRREDATLYKLMKTLEEIQRFDLSEEIEKVTGYKLPKTPQMRLDCEHHGCEAKFPTTMMFNGQEQETSMKENSIPYCAKVGLSNMPPPSGMLQERLSPLEGNVGFVGNGDDIEMLPTNSSRSFDTKVTMEGMSEKPDVINNRPAELRNTQPKGEFVDKGTFSVDDNGNTFNTITASHGFNLNTQPDQKSLKDKAIDNLALLGGISVLGIGAIAALVKLR